MSIPIVNIKSEELALDLAVRLKTRDGRPNKNRLQQVIKRLMELGVHIYSKGKSRYIKKQDLEDALDNTPQVGYEPQGQYKVA